MTEEPDRDFLMNEPMNERWDGSSPRSDAWLETLLRADAARAPHLDDVGFSARVMGVLPVPRKAVDRWLVPAMAVVGGLVAVGLTPAGGYFASNFLGLFALRHFSLTNLSVLVPVALMYACSFAALRER